MKRNVLLFALIISAGQSFAQPPAFVGTGYEYNNYDTVDLTSGTGLWATDRTAVPGYYNSNNDGSGNGLYINASDAHNINGYVKRNGPGAFTFPVGNGTVLHSLSISAPSSGQLTTLATAWIDGDPSLNLDPTWPNGGSHPRFDVGAGIETVNSIGEWDWQDPFNTGFGVIITVTIPDMTGFAMRPNLRLVGWNGSFWQDLSHGITATGNTAGSTLSGTMVAGISAIAIGSIANILDITLSSFNVAEQNCNASLTWITTHEDANTNIGIEYSTNGLSFINVANLTAQYPGTGGTYHYSVPQNSGEPYYYRLKITNDDGSYHYSDVKTLTTYCGTEGDYMRVYPNPVVGATQANLRFKTDYRGSATLIIVNNMGQQFVSQAANIVADDNTIPVNTGAMPAGVYYIRLTSINGNNIGTIQKMIKQ